MGDETSAGGPGAASREPSAPIEGSREVASDAEPPLQLDHAEYAEGSGVAGASCSACSRPIPDAYWQINSVVVCPSCRDIAIAARSGGSGTVRFLKAAAIGGAAAGVASIIWYVIREVTGYELGVVALGVGLLVGWAVKRGSGGRGGWAYQSLAIFLTYGAIVITYVPVIIGAILAPPTAAPGTAVAGSAAPASPSPATSTSDFTTPAALGTSELAGTATDAAAPAPAVSDLFVGFLLILAIAFAAPFLAGFENIIGILIIGFALYEAWKLNRMVPFKVVGPFGVVGVPAGLDGPGAVPPDSDPHADAPRVTTTDR